MSLRSFIRRITVGGARFALAALAALAIVLATAPGAAQASVFKNDTRWPISPGGYVNIPVCIADGSSAEEKGDGSKAGLIHDRNPSLDEVVGHMRMALARSWEQWSSARFVGWKNCTELSEADRQKSVSLYINPNAENYSSIGITRVQGQSDILPGVHIMPWGNTWNRCITYNGVTTHVQYSFDCAEQYAIHEFGHALGFDHEWKNPATDGTCFTYHNDLSTEETRKHYDPILTARHSGIYDLNYTYTIVNPTAYDRDSIMTYDQECADVTGVRFGSENLSDIDRQGAQAIYPPVASWHGRYDVGVIPDATGCRDTTQIAISMDDENDRSSSSSGWVGAMRLRGDTRLEFCRVDGSKFAPTTAGPYAVLKLGDQCPAGSSQFSRHFDSEDTDADKETTPNYIVGDAGPNSQPRNVAHHIDTDLYFCIFSTNYKPASATPFPALPYSYGVFAFSLTSALDYGQLVIEGETNDNRNKTWVDDLNMRPAVTSIFSDWLHQSTLTNVVKVAVMNLPTISTGGVSDIKPTSATLNATVNAHNIATTVTFEWGQQSGAYTNKIVGAPSPIVGPEDAQVIAKLRDLVPNTTYYYRVVAANSRGSVPGAEQSFTTKPMAPTVTTRAANDITSASATLNATVNAQNSLTTVLFRLQTRGVLEMFVMATPDRVSGRADTVVTAPVSNLRPNTSYLIHVEAENNGGESRGNIVSFTTSPVATDDSYSTGEDTPLAIAAPGLLANDSLVEGNPLTAALVGGPSNGTLALNPDGSFNYTSNVDFNGNDSFTYKVSNGLDSNVATVHITVNPVDDAPVAADDSYTTDEDIALAIAAPGLLANDQDIDSSVLTPVIVSSPLSGTLALNSDGSFSYTPNVDFNSSDSFSYKLNDGALDSNVATVHITVNPVDDAATIAIAPGAQCALDNTPSAMINLALVDLDTSVNDLIVTASSSNQDLLPDSSIVISGTGASRMLSLVTAPQQHGQATITIAVSDGHSRTATSVNLLVGTTGADALTGSDGTDIIFGLQSDDTIAGLGGDDLLCGNDGNDSINGGDGNDAIYGGDSNDHLIGEAGDDMLDGGKGDDTLDGGAGDDVLAGWSGRDMLSGGDGNDILTGGNSDDQLDGGAGDDALDGGKGNDTLAGGLGVDVFHASPGRDQEVDFDAGQGDTHTVDMPPALRSLVAQQDAEAEPAPDETTPQSQP